ncbi:MAG: hypothetical protein ABSH48_02275 [Verrucomicrobiota bacterium]
MHIRSIIVVGSVVIGALVACRIGAEVYYVKSITPRGVLTVADHFRRLGEPLRIVEFTRDGATYFEFIGVPHGFHALVTPSAPPSYIYDESGKFVEWCSDPVDQPAFRKRWPLTKTVPIDIAAFGKKYEN